MSVCMYVYPQSAEKLWKNWLTAIKLYVVYVKRQLADGSSYIFRCTPATCRTRNETRAEKQSGKSNKRICQSDNIILTISL